MSDSEGMPFEFAWSAKERPKETTTVEKENNSISQTLLQMRQIFVEEINSFIESQNMEAEDVALFEEVVSEEEEAAEEEGKVGNKRKGGGQRRWSKFKKKSKQHGYGKKSR